MSELSDIIEESLMFAEPSLEEIEEGKPWYYSRKAQVNLLSSLVNVIRCIDKGIPYIRSVAIQAADNGTIFSLPRPARHHDVLAWMRKNGADHRNSVQGFIDSHHRFVEREEAFKIAENADQILDWDDVRPPHLFSEDLW